MSLPSVRILYRRLWLKFWKKRKFACALYRVHWPRNRRKPTYCMWRFVWERGQWSWFLKKIVIGDKSWCFAYDPATKRQSSAWVGENSQRPHKVRFQKSRGKTMLFIFFSWQGVLHQEFVLEGQTINFEFYREVTDRILKILRRVRPGRLNQRAGSCCTIMLLTTTQISTSSFS
jgi:hypothetical protein